VAPVASVVWVYFAKTKKMCSSARLAQSRHRRGFQRPPKFCFLRHFVSGFRRLPSTAGVSEAAGTGAEGDGGVGDAGEEEEPLAFAMV